MQTFQTTALLVNEFAGFSVSDQFGIPLTRLKRSSADEIVPIQESGRADVSGSFRSDYRKTYHWAVVA